jgi:hypothetical protein
MAVGVEFRWARNSGLGSNGANTILRFASLRPTTGSSSRLVGTLTVEDKAPPALVGSGLQLQDESMDAAWEYPYS